MRQKDTTIIPIIVGLPLRLELIDWIKVLRLTRRKIGHFGDVFPTPFPGIVLNKLDLTQYK